MVGPCACLRVRQASGRKEGLARDRKQKARLLPLVDSGE
jgi:hypothetical protein